MNGGRGLPPFMPMFGAGMPLIPPQQLTREASASNPHFLPNAVPNTIAAAMTNQNRVPPGQHMSATVPPPPNSVRDSLSKGILLPHDHDVMYGRNAREMAILHRGNMWYRRLVHCNRQLYRDSANIAKNLLCKAIIQIVQNQNPPGRFIECDKDTGIWYQIPFKQAIHKTSRTFRENYEDDGLDELELKTVNISVYPFKEVSVRMPPPLPPVETFVRMPPPLPPVDTTPRRTPAKRQEGPASMCMSSGPESAIPAARPFTSMMPGLRVMPPGLPGLSAMAPTAPGVPPASRAMSQSALMQADINRALAAFVQARMYRAQMAQMPPVQGTFGQAPSKIPASAAPSMQTQRPLAPKVPAPGILAPIARGKPSSSKASQTSAPRTPSALAPAPKSHSTFALDNLANLPAVQARALPQNQGTKHHSRDQTWGGMPQQGQSMLLQQQQREQLARHALEQFAQRQHDALKCSLAETQQSSAVLVAASSSLKKVEGSRESHDSNAQSLLDENNAGEVNEFRPSEIIVDDETTVEVEERLDCNMPHAMPIEQQKVRCAKMAKPPDDTSSIDAKAQAQTSTEYGQSLVQMIENGGEKLPHKPHHHHHHLNEDTLNMLKSHLQSDPGEYLDEEVIAAQILKMDRVKRRRFQCDLSDVSEDNNADLRQAYQPVEDYSLALDFYNNAVASTRKENPDTVLDKRTLDWLRKAMGLDRRDDFWGTPQAEQSDEAHDETGSHGPKTKRRTRGLTRRTHVQKRVQRSTVAENKGLDALMSAVTDLEKEFGPFRESASRKRKKQKTSSYASNVSHKKYETRKRPKNGSHAVHAMDEKFEKHHQSMAKPRSVTMPNEIHEKCHRSTVLPSVSLDLPAPILIRRNGGREHGLAMLAQRFYVITSGSQDINLRDVVNQLGIPKRRIYDVVNILEGAGLLESTTSRNIYRWKCHGDFSFYLLGEENRRLKQEDGKLDLWIELQAASLEQWRRVYAGMKKKDDGLENDSRDKVMIDVDERKSEENEIRPSIEEKGGNTNATDGGTSARGEVQEDSDLDGEIRARKRPRREATGRMRQDDTANTNGVNSSCNGLALLAQRFHRMLITATSDIVDPIDAVKELGIPKRRIYDVVNILEGASVIERTTSSEEVIKYRWIHIGDLGLKDLEEEERQLDEWIKQTSRLVVSYANSLELHITSQQLSPLLDESSTALAIAMPCKSIVHLPHELEKGPENGHHSFALIYPKTHDRQQSMLPKAFILESGKDNVVSMHHLSLIPPQMEDNIDVHEDTPMQAM